MKACLVAALTLLASPVSAAAVYEQSGTLVNNTASDRVLDLGVVFFQKSFDQPNKSVVSYFTFDRAPTYLQAITFGTSSTWTPAPSSRAKIASHQGPTAWRPTGTTLSSALMPRKIDMLKAMYRRLGGPTARSSIATSFLARRD
jgi:hypothetical protein